MILKLTLKGKRFRSVNTMLKKNKFGVLTFSSFKSDYKAIVINMSELTHGPMATDSHKYSELIFVK